jgi:hypothetical protein
VLYSLSRCRRSAPHHHASSPKSPGKVEVVLDDDPLASAGSPGPSGTAAKRACPWLCVISILGLREGAIEAGGRSERIATSLMALCASALCPWPPSHPAVPFRPCHSYP